MHCLYGDGCLYRTHMKILCRRGKFKDTEKVVRCHLFGMGIGTDIEFGISIPESTSGSTGIPKCPISLGIPSSGGKVWLTPLASFLFITKRGHFLIYWRLNYVKLRAAPLVSSCVVTTPDLGRVKSNNRLWRSQAGLALNTNTTASSCKVGITVASRYQHFSVAFCTLGHAHW